MNSAGVIREADLARVKGNAAGLFRLPPDARRSGGGDGAAMVTTPDQQWAYALEMPPDLTAALSSDRCRVTLALRAHSGQFGVGVETRDRSRFYRWQMTAPGRRDDWQVFQLDTPLLADCGWLIVNNASAEGSSRAEVRLLAIENLSTANRIPGAGLKGGPIDPGRRLAVVWGDSVVCGIGRGWPCLLDDMLSGYQFLNGGIDGDCHDSVLRRAMMLNRERDIALNIILLGWHRHARNENVRTDLLAALGNINNPVLATVPTALNSRIIKYDLSSYLRPSRDHNTSFDFLASQPGSIELQQEIFHHITERNRIICEVAAEARVPVLDLFGAFGTEQLADFRQDFYDVMHPRPAAYEKIARAVCEGLGVLPPHPPH